MLPIKGEERIQRPTPSDPLTRPGSDDGPKSPNVKRPDPSDLLKRMRRVDPDQARRYRQRSGQ
ncbi:MAG TPA: ubiquitin-like protein UBact [Armatimonadota bacterium]|nr:ubiquitin-like protein UBact [Armatimonadota bacterium]